MSLTLAIPVCNDLPGLRRLMAQLPGLDCIDRVAVLDDASDTPLQPEAILPLGWAPDRLLLLRNAVRGGPGVSRNILRDHVETDHVLFFDADDLLTPELPRLMRALAEESFDFCLFSHADSRVGLWHGWGQPALDAAIWRASGVSGPLSAADPVQVAILSETANYPWNKIYRTGFLRENGLGCAETLVHEDVMLHWQSFLTARRVLVSDRIVAQHFVSHAGDRLTNRCGAERLEVFAIFEPVARRIDVEARQDFELPFYRFVEGMIRWIRDNLVDHLHTDLDRLARDFLLAHLDRPRFAALAAADPALALRLNLQLARSAA